MGTSPRGPIATIGLFIFIFSLVPLSTFSETVGSDEMELAATNWLSYLTYRQGEWAGSDMPEITGYEDILMNDTLIARCYHVAPKGYIVVPVLKDLPPVMACSDESDYEAVPDAVYGMPALIRDVLQYKARLFVDYYGSLEAIQADAGVPVLETRHIQEWAPLLVDEKTFEENLSAKALQTTEDFGPLLTSSWHQGAPYNNDCPIGDGGRCAVGCVATATSQILNYYQWPPEGTGELTYYWYGDNSCKGSSPGQTLSADFNDSYDWANIKDAHYTNDTPEEQAAVAELCYEVGVAFRMDYGACGSGAYTADAVDVFPDYFRFHDWIEVHERRFYDFQDWSNLLRTEFEQGRPIQYRIYAHSIVGDGWRTIEPITQVHMNYGWGGSQNAWFTIDQLYCNWEGCSVWEEFAVTNIVPNNGVHFVSDTSWGSVPLAVQYNGVSEMAVDSWTWDFGDGDSAFVQSPNHVYTEPGRYDVKLEIEAEGQTLSYQTCKYVTVLADSVIGVNATGNPGDLVEVVIYVNNTVPLQSLRIPIEYGGSMNLSYSTYSTTGCRTDYFDQKKQVSFDPINKRMAFSLLNSDGLTPDLEAGAGPVLKVYFTIPPSATADQMADIELDGYGSYVPMFFGPIIDYSPSFLNGTVALEYTCGDADQSGKINILDATYLISYLYKGGPIPVPAVAGDPDASGGINILDVTCIISYLYKGGPPPLCP